MMVPGTNSVPAGTTKTLLYTALFIFLFFLMEYSLNHYNTGSPTLEGLLDRGESISSIDVDSSSEVEHDDEDSHSNQVSPSVSYSSHSGLMTLLIEKERLLIDKETKYVELLATLNERDLKLNYVDNQLYKLQSLLNKYKMDTKQLRIQLFDLQHKLNESESHQKSLSDSVASWHLEDPINKVRGYGNRVHDRNDVEIESLLNQTRKRIKEGKFKIENIDYVLRAESKDVIIDKHDDEYILSNRKSSVNGLTVTIDFRLIWDIGILIVFATFGGIVASLSGQPLILGYLLGGSLVGPGGLKLIQQYVQVETLAHIGSIFLLFNVGIELKVHKLRAYLEHSVLSLILCCCMLYLMCYLWFAFVSNESSFSFINISIFVFASLNSSTTVILKTWADLRLEHSDNQQLSSSRKIIEAILVFQDVYFVFFTAMFCSFTQEQENEHFVYKLIMAILAMGIVFKALPQMLFYLRTLISIDIYILFTVSICIIFTLITQNVFDSSGLGAFSAGALIAKSNHHHPSHSNITMDEDDKVLRTNWQPIRNIFGVIFYSSIGMLINPMFLWSNWHTVLSLVALIAIAKWLMIYVSVFFLQHRDKNAALTVSSSLALQGEFAFVLSSHAHQDGLITKSMHTALIGATAVSIMCTPFVIRHFPSFFDQMCLWVMGDRASVTRRVQNERASLKL